MDDRKKILKDLESRSNDGTTDGDALIKELESRYDAPREVIEKTIADWMAGEKQKGRAQ